MAVTTITLLLMSILLPISWAVNTTTGQIMGVTDTTQGVTKYLGIPYAEPPIGELRFRKPQPKTPGVYNATSYQPICPQTLQPFPVPHAKGEKSEDCLFLNIYVPESGPGFESRPVMVFLHGGAFVMGSGSDYDGSLLAKIGQVIVVTVNYRLGILGWLSTGDSTLPGNLGMWDQLMALRWINDNIGAFGGDTSRITLFGQSAGAACAELFAVSDRASGMFQKLIIQSGYVFSGFLLQSDPANLATRIGEHLQCPNRTMPGIVECLSAASVDEIMSTQSAVPGPYLPTIDGDIVQRKPDGALVKRTSQYDMMIGLNQDEGRAFLPLYIMITTGNISPSIENGTDEETYNSLVSFLTQPFDGTGNLAALYKQFDNNPADPISRVRSASNLFSDVKFVLSTVQEARIHSSSGGRTYMYRFDAYNLFPWSLNTSWAHADGATHTDELRYLFGTVNDPEITNTPPNDIPANVRLMDIMMRYWANFAHTGSPNLPRSPALPTWPRFDIRNEKYIKLDRYMNYNFVGSRLFKDRVTFWREHIPMYGPVVVPPSTAARNLMTYWMIVGVYVVIVLLL